MKLKVIIAAVVLGAVAVCAAASSATPAAWTIERYSTTETWNAFADIGTKDAGPTDIYVAQRTLTSTDGKRVGVVNGYGVNLHRPYVFFHWTASLDGGSLTLEGAVSLRNDTSTYAIEGGTGRYAGARGTVTLVDSGKNRAVATVRYRR